MQEVLPADETLQAIPNMLEFTKIDFSKRQAKLFLLDEYRTEL